MKVWWPVIALLFLCSLGASAQEGGLPYPPKMRDARVEVYKTIGDVKLNLYMFNPPESTPAARRAAIVFFFGGAWRGGSPAQFEAQCRHLASLAVYCKKFVSESVKFSAGLQERKSLIDKGIEL